MQNKVWIAGSLTVALGLSMGSNAVQADEIWDMMNPAWWMGLDDDDDDDWKYWVYGPGRYAWGGGPYGYGAPYHGYGPGYHGWGRHPGAFHGQPAKKKKVAPPRVPE